MKDDTCFSKTQQNDNDSKLKYITTSFTDLINAKKDFNFFGIDIKDKLFVPSDKIDQESSLKYTNTPICHNRDEFKGLPMATLPARYQGFHGDTTTEYAMGNYIECKRNSCVPKDTDFYKRSFYIFDENNVPKAENSLFPERYGVSSRFISRTM